MMSALMATAVAMSVGWSPAAVTSVTRCASRVAVRGQAVCKQVAAGAIEEREPLPSIDVRLRPSVAASRTLAFSSWADGRYECFRLFHVRRPAPSSSFTIPRTALERIIPCSASCRDASSRPREAHASTSSTPTAGSTAWARRRSTSSCHQPRRRRCAPVPPPPHLSQQGLTADAPVDLAD